MSKNIAQQINDKTPAQALEPFHSTCSGGLETETEKIDHLHNVSAQRTAFSDAANMTGGPVNVTVNYYSSLPSKDN